VLGPDAGVDDADYDVLARVLRAAELRPQASARLGEAEERRRGRGRRLLKRVLRDVDDARQRGQLRGLLLAQLGCEAVERINVVVELAGPNGGSGICMLAVQVGDVLRDVSRVRVDLLTLGRRGRLVAGDATLVGHDRIVSELDDVGRGRGM